MDGWTNGKLSPFHGEDESSILSPPTDKSLSLIKAKFVTDQARRKIATKSYKRANHPIILHFLHK